MNPHRGQAEIELGGEKLTLTIDYNALAEIEDATGVSFLSGLDDVRSKIGSIKFIRAAIAVAASTRTRRYSPQQIGEMLSETGKIIEAGLAVNTAIARFFNGALPQPKEVSEERPTKEPSAPGSPGQA